MAIAEVIDIQSLLLPISDESPSGQDPRAGSSAQSAYFRIKDARNAARSAERAQVDNDSAPPEEWGTVVDTGIEILSAHGKDLEVAAWMIEGLLRLGGFAGLRDGFRLMTGLVNGYWETCFPEIDEDGIEGKVSTVAGLNGSGAIGTLIQPIRLQPLTDGSLARYSLWNYEQATELQKITDASKVKERIEGGAVSMDQFMQSVRETPVARFVETVEVISEARNALKEMSDAFDAVAGVDAPPVSALREMLEEIERSIRHFAADKLAMAVSSDERPDASEPVADGDQSGQGGEAATIKVRRIEGYASRDEALTDLVRISNYFRKTEPQSPISYTLDEAVRRARMSLPELLMELVEDPSHTRRILLAAGIRPPEAEGGY